MLQDPHWDTTDTLARSQFRIYRELGEAMRIDEQDCRRVLLLGPQEWSDWAQFMQAGPLPAEPPLPVMLQRLGRATHRLAVLAERQGARA